jgi:uncharacterized protein (DUF1330 family)
MCQYIFGGNNVDVTNAVFPEMAQAVSFFGSAEDGPFVMVNLLKFKERAEYEDGSDASLSGRAAYLRYGAAVQSCLAEVGGRGLYSGAVTGLLLGEIEEPWDMVALAEYPSLAAMQAMIALPSYQAIEKHRKAGLAGQLNIRTKAMGA